MSKLLLVPSRRHRRLPQHERDADGRRRRRGARAPRAQARGRVRQGRHRRRGRGRCGCPAAAAVALNGLHRAIAGAAEPTQGRLFVEAEERPDETPVGEASAARNRVSRRRRGDPRAAGDDGRIAAFVGRSPSRSTRRYVGLPARPHLRAEGADPRGCRRDRASRAVSPAAARATRLMQIRQPDPRGRQHGDGEAAARIHPAEAARLDPEGARRGRDVGRRGVPTRSQSRRCPTMCASRPSASSVGSSAWVTARRRRRRSAATSTGSSPFRGESAPRSGSTRGDREVLDADHAGLDDVKERIVEYIAVRKLREERGIEPDKKSGAILTLIGPPGTGKTSIGESIARSLNREFVRMSLGGIRDEAEIEDIGAPTSVRFPAGSCARYASKDDESGDPARRGRQDRRGLARRPLVRAARGARPGPELTFRDHYLDVELDLSEVVFIATGNQGGDDSRASPRSDGGHPLRRVHERREGGDCHRLPLAASARAQRLARGRGHRRRRRARDRDLRVHPRGRGAPARA